MTEMIHSIVILTMKPISKKIEISLTYSMISSFQMTFHKLTGLCETWCLHLLCFILWSLFIFYECFFEIFTIYLCLYLMFLKKTWWGRVFLSPKYCPNSRFLPSFLWPSLFSTSVASYLMNDSHSL